MHWNYRLARKRREHIYKEKIKVTYDYFIVEAYYDNNGKVGMITTDATSLFGENVEQLADGFVKMKEAFYAPILDYDKIPEPGYKESDDSFSKALSGEFLREIEEIDDDDDDDDSEINEQEMIVYDNEVEAERVATETLYSHLIREFIREKQGPIKLADFYIKR